MDNERSIKESGAQRTFGPFERKLRKEPGDEGIPPVRFEKQPGRGHNLRFDSGSRIWTVGQVSANRRIGITAEKLPEPPAS